MLFEIMDSVANTSYCRPIYSLESCSYTDQNMLTSNWVIYATHQWLHFANILLLKGGLRFFRVCVSIRDEFYNRSLIKNNIFEATIRVLLDTKGQDCLLNSACLDLLEFIRKENIKMLVNHLITQFGTVLDTITYITTCQQLREKHKENINTAASSDDKMDEQAVSR